jgi:hypothetical protein
MVVAARRKNADARVDDRRVFDESRLAPDILLTGAKHNQDVKCFELGQATRPVAALTNQFECERRANTVNLCQICTEHAAKRNGPQRQALLRAWFCCKPWADGVDSARERLRVLLGRTPACEHIGGSWYDENRVRQRLVKREETFISPVP